MFVAILCNVTNCGFLLYYGVGCNDFYFVGNYNLIYFVSATLFISAILFLLFLCNVVTDYISRRMLH